jgi:hypothetical protein
MKKPLSHTQMVFAIGIAFAAGVLPVYLAVCKNNVIPCAMLLIVARAYPFIRRQLGK